MTALIRIAAAAIVLAATAFAGAAEGATIAESIENTNRADANTERDGARKPDPNQYWLRTDPVTLWADMARVVMTSYGFADLDEFERNEIENSVRSVLLEEGIHLHADHTERWCIALGEPLNFRFTPLEEALGMDLAEAMPEQAEALHWRRIMNEIQSQQPGVYFPAVVHPSAVLARDVVLDEGVVVMPGAVIMAGCKLGACSLMNTKTSLDHESSRTHIARMYCAHMMYINCQQDCGYTSCVQIQEVYYSREGLHFPDHSLQQST